MATSEPLQIFDPDTVVTRNQLDDDHYLDTKWSAYEKDAEDQREYRGTSDALKRLPEISISKDTPRPLALGLSSDDVDKLDFAYLRYHMLRNCFPVDGLRTKRALMDMLDAERASGVAHTPPSWYQKSAKDFGRRRIGLKACSAEYCFAVETEASGAFSRCSKCKVVIFCSRTCQAKDWKARHKHVCAKVTEERELTDRYATMYTAAMKEKEAGTYICPCRGCKADRIEAGEEVECKGCHTSYLETEEGSGGHSHSRANDLRSD